VRSLSVKKVAVAAAGAALLGMAFAGATTVDPSVGNFVFFKNGEPNVQVVVGSAADVSDGVAAAQIAAMLGNLAYSDQAVTASSGGMMNSTGSGTGTITGQSVTLSTTAPIAAGSSQTGSVTLGTQPYDYLEFKESVANTTRGDFTNLNPLGNGVTSGGYMISGDNNPSVAFKGSVSNVGSNSVTEDEHLFIEGESYFTTATGGSGTYTADRVQVADQYNFTSPIPYYIGSTLGSNSSAQSGVYYDASGNQILSTDSNIVTNANVPIQFLGQPYVITGFPASNSSLSSASLSLGAQAVIQLMSAGNTVTVGNTTVTLVSISPIAVNNEPSAYFQISQNGNVVDSATLQPGQTYNNFGVEVAAQSIFVGTGTSSYVKAAVYSQAITLQNGNQIVFAGNNSATTLDNGQSGGVIWSAAVNFTQVNVGSATGVPALGAITLTSQTSSRIPVGGSFNLMTYPVYKQLTFLGLQTVPHDTLRVFAIGNQRFNINPAANTTAINGTLSWVGVGLPSGYSSQVNGGNGYNYVELQSTDGSAFQLGGATVNTLYINKDIGGLILYKDPNDGNYTYATTGLNQSLTYQYPSSPMSGNIQTQFQSNVTNATYLYIKEPVVNNDPAGAIGNGWYAINLYDNVSDSNYGSYLYNSNNNNNNNVLTVPYNAYAPGLSGNVQFGNGTQQQGFWSPGGSELATVSTSEVDVSYAQMLPMAQWLFGAASNVTVGVGGTTTQTVTLTPGENYTLGTGYTVSVASIGGTASCTGGTAGSAVCTPSTASVVTPIDPTQLVVLDSQANTNDQMIVVGGPYVNSIAATLPGADTATESPGDSVVTVIGNDVLVAGYAAQDTMSAAQALVSWLNQNRATVRNTV